MKSESRDCHGLNNGFPEDAPEHRLIKLMCLTCFMNFRGKEGREVCRHCKPLDDYIENRCQKAMEHPSYQINQIRARLAELEQTMGKVTDNDLIMKAQSIASNLTYSEEPQGAAKHIIKELCHRLGGRVARIHKKKDGYLMISLFGDSRFLTRKEAFLWRFFKTPPAGMTIVDVSQMSPVQVS